ncbi:MAG: cytochrome b/b6 domain-containing protein [Pseudomonadota bacterium]
MTTQGPAYHGIARLLHWLIAALIALQYLLHELAERATASDSTARALGLIANHKSVGITVLGLAVIRLAWRLANSPPDLPRTMPRWQVRLSTVAHVALYALMLALPVSGWLMSSAAGYSVSWFNAVQLPDLMQANEGRAINLESIHEILAKALFLVALLHILAACKHGLVDRDGVMGRMASTTPVLIGIVVLTVGAWQLSRVGAASDSALPGPATGESAGELALPVQALVPSSLPTWSIDDESSFIRFSGEQAGASFDGEWLEWSADLQFDAERLAESRFVVVIQTTAVDAGDTDREETIRSADWFAVDEFPQARFLADTFRLSADGLFVAAGQLIIKDRATPTELTFTVTESNADRVLSGTATLSRLALGVGTGEWADPTWVGDTVSVTVKVVATVVNE